jgi:hypothetical protein
MDTKDRDSLISEIAESFSKFKLPKRQDKVELTTMQRDMIKMWVRPTATFSVQCAACSNMFSSGHLAICSADPTTFCEKKRIDWQPITPAGYTDEELLYYYGWTRDEL